MTLNNTKWIVGLFLALLVVIPASSVMATDRGSDERPVVEPTDYNRRVIWRVVAEGPLHHDLSYNVLQKVVCVSSTTHSWKCEYTDTYQLILVDRDNPPYLLDENGIVTRSG